MRVPALAGSFLALVACSGPPEVVDSRADAILGGAADGETAVLAVGDAHQNCSGALIAPNVVLTARHCVASTTAENTPGTPVCSASFGTPEPVRALVVTTGPVAPIQHTAEVLAAALAVSAIVVPDGPASGALCGNDIALLVLKEPLAGALPFALGTPRAGDAFSAVGFGDDGAGSLVTRRRRDGLDVGCVGTECGRADVAESEWVGTAVTCNGDSGGPALDDHGRVIGVVSRGSLPCGTDAIFTSTERWRAWIEENLARFAPAKDAPAPTEGAAPVEFATASGHEGGCSPR